MDPLSGNGGAPHTALTIRNQRVITAWNTRQQDDARRATAGLPPKTRRQRRKTRITPATTTAPP